MKSSQPPETTTSSGHPATEPLNVGVRGEILSPETAMSNTISQSNLTSFAITFYDCSMRMDTHTYKHLAITLNHFIVKT